MQHWDRIEAFVEVVRHESFAGAARALGVSSSHVSRLVARLEKELGTQLLYRTTRRLGLTDAGTVYYEHCAQLFDGFQEALTAISDYQQQPKGVLKLTFATTFGEKFIAPVVNDFLVAHPQLSVRMDFTNRRVDIIDEGFDVAIRTGALPDSTLIARKLCERREYVVGSAAYFDRHPRPHTLGNWAATTACWVPWTTGPSTWTASIAPCGCRATGGPIPAWPCWTPPARGWAWCSCRITTCATGSTMAR